MTHPVPESPYELEDATQFPCGCVIGSFKGSAVMWPCRPSCGNYQFALRQAAITGKPIQFDSDLDKA